MQILNFMQSHHLWVAVVVPGVLSALALWAMRAEAFTGDMLVAVLCGLLIAWMFRRWYAAGLHILPAAMVSIAAISGAEFIDGSCWRSLRRGALIAAWVWVTTLAVDLLECYGDAQCRMQDTGGDGLLDGLVMGPLASIALSLLVWTLLGRGGKKSAPSS